MRGRTARNAWLAGWDAAKAGRTIETNPYYHPDYAREWLRGFRAALAGAVDAMKRRRPELQAAA